MKRLYRGLLMGICGFSVLGLVSTAHAADEVFDLTAWFGVSKCTKIAAPRDGQPKTECKIENESKPIDVAVKLDNCRAQLATAGQICTGTWSVAQTIDGHVFIGKILVSKSTDAAGKVSYSILSQTGQKDAPDANSLHLLLLSKQTPTDSSFSFGRTLMAKSSTGEDLTYLPVLAIGPKGSLSLNESRLF